MKGIFVSDKDCYFAVTVIFDQRKFSGNLAILASEVWGIAAQTDDENIKTLAREAGLAFINTKQNGGKLPDWIEAAQAFSFKEYVIPQFLRGNLRPVEIFDIPDDER